MNVCMYVCKLYIHKPMYACELAYDCGTWPNYAIMLRLAVFIVFRGAMNVGAVK